MTTRLAIVCLWAPDLTAAAHFYRQMFGWTFEHFGEPMDYTTFKSGTIGGGFTDLSEMYTPGDILAYVESDDINADLGKAESLGAHILVRRTEIPGEGWFGIFTDPTGNRMALYTRKRQ